MNSTRIIARRARPAQFARLRTTRNVRFASDTSSAASQAGGLGSGVTGGLVGGGAVFGATYLWYHFSGAKTAVQTAKQAQSYYENAKSKVAVTFKENTPSTNEALEVLKQSAYKYASFVPGGRAYVDRAFDDLATIRDKHGPEVDEIISQAYGELRDVSKQGLSFDTAAQTWDIVSKYLQQLTSLAVDAGSDILKNHPELKQKLGGSFDQISQLSDQLGPEAKKLADQTWQQINDIVKSGVSFDTVEKIRRVVQEKQNQLRELGEQAWEKGQEQIKPMLDKNPKMKQLIEENASTLKNGNVGETIKKVQEAVSSGNIGNLEQYVNSLKDKAQNASSSDLSDWLNMIPGGSAILPQLQKFKDVADKQGGEAAELIKETVGEIKEVLEKRSKQAEELLRKGQ